MLLYAHAACLRRCTSSSMYYSSTPNQIQGSFAPSMALWKYSQLQAVKNHEKTGLAGFPLNKNIKSSNRQNATCVVSSGRLLRCRLSTGDHSLSVKVDIPSHKKFSSISWNSRSLTRRIGGTATGLCLSFAVSGMASAEGPVDNNTDSTQTALSSTSSTHGKTIYTDYSVTGIPGDGRCMFRSVAHGACIRSGKPIPDEDLQRKLADELRTMVADEFIKRREETEWFIEGDFDTYVSQIRKPHVWGGEPELLMASHVLQMPITVYMYDEEAGGLIAIAEYGQEYGNEDPIRVLYHGFGHYDALHIPGKRGPKSRL